MAGLKAEVFQLPHFAEWISGIDDRVVEAETPDGDGPVEALQRCDLRLEVERTIVDVRDGSDHAGRPVFSDSITKYPVSLEE